MHLICMAQIGIKLAGHREEIDLGPHGAAGYGRRDFNICWLVVLAVWTPRLVKFDDICLLFGIEIAEVNFVVYFPLLLISILHVILGPVIGSICCSVFYPADMISCP